MRARFRLFLFEDQGKKTKREIHLKGAYIIHNGFRQLWFWTKKIIKSDHIMIYEESGIGTSKYTSSYWGCCAVELAQS